MIGFVTFEKQDNRPQNSVGSTRIRARWLYDGWDEAEEYQMGKKYDVLVFQKVYWETMMQSFDGIKILDLCDPDWLEGKDVMRYASMADAVTTSTQALADYIKRFVDVPVICVPDRIKIDEHIHYQKISHRETPKEIVWFGYAQNAHYIDHAIPYLIRKGLKLTVISNQNYQVPSGMGTIQVRDIRYSYPTVHKVIGEHDFLLMPDPSDIDIKGHFKSNNKTLTAWALKVPVIKVPEDFDRLWSKEAREQEAEERYQEILDDWLVEKSVEQMKEIIEDAKNNRERNGKKTK